MTFKTTVYLDEDIRAAIRFTALDRQVPEAEVIRQALRASLGGADLPAPQGAVFDGGQPVDWNSGDPLKGFGEW
jgi:hypothetical protein